MFSQTLLDNHKSLSHWKRGGGKREIWKKITMLKKIIGKKSQD